VLFSDIFQYLKLSISHRCPTATSPPNPKKSGMASQKIKAEFIPTKLFFAKASKKSRRSLGEDGRHPKQSQNPCHPERTAKRRAKDLLQE
jgi:hypothetical protein